MVGKPPRTSLNDHERLRCFARSFRALGVRRLLLPTFSHRGIMQACGLPRNTIQSAQSRGAERRANRSLRPRRPAKSVLRSLRPARAKLAAAFRRVPASEVRIDPLSRGCSSAMRQTRYGRRNRSGGRIHYRFGKSATSYRPYPLRALQARRAAPISSRRVRTRW